MFEQSFVPVSIHKLWTVGLALLSQALAIAVLVVVPMLYVQTLPEPSLTSVLTITLPPRPPAPPPPPAKQSRTQKIKPRTFKAKVLLAPVHIPKQVPLIQDLPPSVAQSVLADVPGGVPGGVDGGVPGGMLNALPSFAPPSPLSPAKPAPSSKPAPPPRIQVGGQVQAALLIHEVTPRYPPLARQARIDGTVLLKAIIGRDGSVEHLTFVSGNILLEQATMDAVKQWVYKPTYLNGIPVEVATEIAVHFSLTS